MGKRIINTEQAPAAIGPYSQATEQNGMLFISGQIPIDPVTEELIEGGIKVQTEQVLENLQAILKEAGYTLEQVMKIEVFIADMDQFSQLNEVYEEYFGKQAPARACVEVARLPKDVAVEMSLIAAK